jgi:predicted ATPase
MQAGLSYLEQGVVDERLYFQTNVALRRTPSCLVVSAWALWSCGFADQARQRSLEALAAVDAGEYRPFAKAWTFAMAAISAQFRREIAVMYEWAERALQIAAEHNFPQVLGWAMTFRGWAVAMQGQLEEGERLMHRGMDTFLALGLVANMPYFLALLAEVQWKMEKPGEALKTIGEALTVVADTGECYWEAEIYRLRGLVLLSGSPENHPEAETCFHQALDIARQQQARSLELRAAISLARLWQSQGKRQDAHDLLAPVYNWFTEGFDTADLKDARALLAELTCT